MINIVGEIGNIKVNPNGELTFVVTTSAMANKPLISFLVDNCNSTLNLSIDSAQLELPGLVPVEDVVVDKKKRAKKAELLAGSAAPDPVVDNLEEEIDQNFEEDV